MSLAIRDIGVSGFRVKEALGIGVQGLRLKVYLNPIKPSFFRVGDDDFFMSVLKGSLGSGFKASSLGLKGLGFFQGLGFKVWSLRVAAEQRAPHRLRRLKHPI